MNKNKKIKAIDGLLYAIIIIMIIGTLYPLVYVLSSSLSSTEAVTTGKVWLLPIDFNFEAYKKVFANPMIWTGYGNAIYITVVGTIVNILLTISGAYSLSKRRLRGRKIITFAVTLTMWFNAGMIPFYLNLRELGLLDTRAAIILGFGCSAFYIILLRTYFESVPLELEESAKLDGANDFQILTKIYLPLSKPALATIGLYYAVSRWNGYFWSMVAIKDPAKMPLQVILRKMIVEMDIGDELMQSADVIQTVSKETFIFATIIIGIIPMLIVYPMVQKYFKKGLMIGSVKG